MRIVRRQINRRAGPGEAFYRVQRNAGNVLIWADAINLASEHQFFIIRGVASKKERGAFILNQDGDMMRRVTGCGNCDNITCSCQTPACTEGAKRLSREIERYWIEPRGPPIGKVSAHAAYPTACSSQLTGSNEDFTVWEMCKAAVVIHVQMRENDAFHISRPDAERAQLWADFFFTVDSKRNFPSNIGMKGGPGFEQMRSLAGIDDDDTFAMLDDPCVCRQPLGPAPVGENGELS